MVSCRAITKLKEFFESKNTKFMRIIGSDQNSPDIRHRKLIEVSEYMEKPNAMYSGSPSIRIRRRKPCIVAIINMYSYLICVEWLL